MAGDQKSCTLKSVQQDRLDLIRVDTSVVGRHLGNGCGLAGSGRSGGDDDGTPRVGDSNLPRSVFSSNCYEEFGREES